ncbi:MAG: hypothetical protein AAGC71_11665 [Pseudomonadota bacterium]
MTTHADIESLLSDYAAAWAANDPDKIASYWDQSAETHFYKAEEFDDYFATMAEIKNYWAHNEGFHEAIKLGFSLVRVSPLAGGISLVITRMRWDIRFASDATNADGTGFASAGKAMGGDNHVLALVTGTADGPRFIGWSETPDAPVKYIWRLYEEQARL